MSKGFLIYAMSNTRGIDYVRHARVLSASIKKHNKNNSVSLVTDLAVADKLFDNVIHLEVETSEWTQSHLHTAYHLSPYHETIHIEADSLVLNSIDHWWTALQPHDILFTSKIRDFRGHWASGLVYRKHFDRLQLPVLYSGLYYFRKSKQAKFFHSAMRYVTENWSQLKPAFFDTNINIPMGNDEIASIASVIANCEDTIVSKLLPLPYFTHMKNSVNGWPDLDHWMYHTGTFVDEQLNLRIGPYLQTGVLHYQNKDFLTDEIEKRYVASVL